MLADGAWRDGSCVVVGGGPSLRGFDWGRLAGRRVLAVNRAWERVPRAADAWVVTSDARFLDAYSDALDAAPFPRVYVAAGAPRRDALNVETLERCGAVGPWGTALATGVRHGGNSGLAALNLADLLGADPIYLLGLDCGGDDGRGRQAWWHDGYPWGAQPASVYERQYVAFATVTPYVRSRVVVVGRSKLDALFERGELGG